MHGTRRIDDTRGILHRHGLSPGDRQSGTTMHMGPGTSRPGPLPVFALAFLLCPGTGVHAMSPETDTKTTEAEAPRTEPAPEHVAGRRLSFATLGWHPPQTGAQALARFNESDISTELKRGEDVHFVPKGEYVFVLKTGERIPGFDCDPGAGRLFIEFVFGPDGPVIFIPAEGGGYCQMGFGIALVVGRTLSMRQADWGNTTYPRGTVRITDRGLEYLR